MVTGSHTDQEVTIELGRRVRQARLGAGLSQRQLAEVAGLHPGTVSKIELGRQNMQTSTCVLRIAALGLKPEDILGGIKFVADPRSVPEPGYWCFEAPITHEREETT